MFTKIKESIWMRSFLTFSKLKLILFSHGNNVDLDSELKRNIRFDETTRFDFNLIETEIIYVSIVISFAFYSLLGILKRKKIPGKNYINIPYFQKLTIKNKISKFFLNSFPRVFN